MKQSRFTEQQMVAILEEGQRGEQTVDTHTATYHSARNQPDTTLKPGCSSQANSTDHSCYNSSIPSYSRLKRPESSKGRDRVLPIPVFQHPAKGGLDTKRNARQGRF